MRLPVVYMDLIRFAVLLYFWVDQNLKLRTVRLIDSHTLPYLDPVRLLPPEMKRHLAKETVLALSPHVGRLWAVIRIY